MSMARYATVARCCLSYEPVLVLTTTQIGVRRYYPSLNSSPGGRLIGRLGTTSQHRTFNGVLSITRGWSEDFVYAASWRPRAAERWSRAVSISRYAASTGFERRAVAFGLG